MACPFFLPTSRTTVPGVMHPERLPLGDAYAGRCTAADVTPTDDMLHDCNLGYASCAHLPKERAADAVRFSVRRADKELITIQYVCEAAHAPIAHGVLRYDAKCGSWRERHADDRVQRMAECCVESLRREQ
jgi:hypothetical protein